MNHNHLVLLLILSIHPHVVSPHSINTLDPPNDMTLFVTERTHNSASFTWNPGSWSEYRASEERYIDRYIVQRSEGTANDAGDIQCREYKFHESIPRPVANATTTLTNLKSNSSYCLVVEAFSKTGRSLGYRSVTFVTEPEPVNAWHRVNIRGSERHGGLEQVEKRNGFSCQSAMHRPSGRRGHSIAVIHDNVYIFGGATVQCLCEFDPKHQREQCAGKNVHSDELWHFDPTTNQFSLLPSEGEMPRGREQHSMTVMSDGSIFVIGGISSGGSKAVVGGGSILLGDVWRLRDPYHVSSLVVRGNDSDNLPMTLTSGTVSHNRRWISSSSLGIDDTLSMPMPMCIKDIRVKLSLNMSCPRELDYISITGPDGIDSNGMPRSGHGETKLLIRSAAWKKDCNHSTSNLVFRDGESESILSHSDLPPSGTFRPASGLMAAFGGSSLFGEWKISIAMSMSQSSNQEQNVSMLVDWELHVEVRPCIARARWERVQTTSDIPPRRLHTAVAVGNSIFVGGGFSDRQWTDLWRLDCNTMTWTQLNAAAVKDEWAMNGRSAVLGPFGVLAYGGLESHGSKLLGRELLNFDFFENEWSYVAVADGVWGRDDNSTNAGPHGRYLTAVGLLTRTDLIHKSSNIDGAGPLVVMFGGDGGLLSNAGYGFTSNSFSEDVWLLSPGGLGMNNMSGRNGDKHVHCRWRLQPNSTFLRMWNGSCAWSESDERGVPDICPWRDIYTVAWCRNHYQSFQMSL